MKVKDLLKSKSNEIISFIGSESKVTEALGFLCKNRIGSLLVRNESGDTIGIITERDIIRAMNDNLKNFTNLLVSDIMTRDLICGLPEDDLNYIMQVMTRNKIRHLPIVHEGKVNGIVSIGDVVNSQLQESRIENHKLQDFLQLSGQI